MAAAEDHQASDIALLDLRPLATFTDFFVLCNGHSDRQIEAISDAIEETLREHGYKPVQREGTKTTGWVVLDYGDVVVHIFAPEERHFYALDELWSRAKPVVRIQ